MNTGNSEDSSVRWLAWFQQLAQPQISFTTHSLFVDVDNSSCCKSRTSKFQINEIQFLLNVNCVTPRAGIVASVIRMASDILLIKVTNHTNIYSFCSIDFDYEHANYSPNVLQVVFRVNYEGFHPVTIARFVASITCGY